MSTSAAVVKYGAVATVNPYATDAAIRTLRDGGNAVDAAISAMLTLGVVDNHNSGIGGGCFILIRMADGRTTAIDAREVAPARATRDMFVRDGVADAALSTTGPLASGVPGALKGYDVAIRKFGRKQIAEVLLPAAELAEKGFVIDRIYAGKLKRVRDDIAKFPASKQLLLKPDGSVFAEGEIVHNADLAATYRAIAKDGVDAAFYRGGFAQKTAEWMAGNGGLLTADDFAKYEAVERPPLEFHYRGQTVLSMPPPSSGGLHLGQILRMLDRFDLPAMSDADRITTVANAMSLAFADRAYWLGDPDFVAVPKRLLDDAYLVERSKLIVSHHALHDVQHGTMEPTPAFPRFDEKHTTHVSVADAEGNVVAITATVNTAFGSKVVVPGTGVVLNDEMDDFSAQPGAANAFGLVGAEANAVTPFKRPLSSMTPTLVLDEQHRPTIVIGAAGGPKIITQVVCVLTNLLDLKLDPKQAMARPRYHHQWRPDELWIEKDAGQPLLDELTKRGFKLTPADASGATNLVVIDPATKAMTSESEPRLPGKAAVE
ncbi:MAG: gamma-glutamyltransferase [Tepidisphaeraceae bacterium]